MLAVLLLNISLFGGSGTVNVIAILLWREKAKLNEDISRLETYVGSGKGDTIC